MVAKRPAQPVVAEQPEKKRRRRRDKEKPKRAMSAYLVFLNKHRDQVVAKHKNWSVTEVTKELARKWKAVSDSERAECQKESDRDKERYYSEMRDYVPLPDEKEDEPPVRYDKDGNRKRRKKDKNAPRKNRSAYIIWAAEYREKNFRPKQSTPNAVSFRDQATELGKAWAALSSAQRKKFEEVASKEAQDYAIKRDAYLTEKKALSVAARNAKRARLLEEKRAWEAARAVASELKEQRRAQKASEKARKERDRAAKAQAKASAPKGGKKEAANAATMDKIRVAINRVARDDAWYAVVGVLEQAPEKVNEAFKNFIDRKGSGADPKAFLVATLGFEPAQRFFL